MKMARLLKQICCHINCSLRFYICTDRTAVLLQCFLGGCYCPTQHINILTQTHYMGGNILTWCGGRSHPPKNIVVCVLKTAETMKCSVPEESKSSGWCCFAGRVVRDASKDLSVIVFRDRHCENCLTTRCHATGKLNLQLHDCSQQQQQQQQSAAVSSSSSNLLLCKRCTSLTNANTMLFMCHVPA
jgi:hypothetical protein